MNKILFGTSCLACKISFHLLAFLTTFKYDRSVFWMLFGIYVFHNFISLLCWDMIANKD